ncbi:hypothetical protein [Lysinibacillus endophyticus]|nr:hypothetical protein [Lysinibacillus endophyticus]MCP1146801.1 hypothetical protein [Lysinibacillus endophyticus]
MNTGKVIKTNTLSEEEQKQFKTEIMTIIEKCSKEEIEMLLHQLDKKIS